MSNQFCDCYPALRVKVNDRKQNETQGRKERETRRGEYKSDASAIWREER